MTAESSPPRLSALLADGAWHSGPALAACLGVSRAAVSARIAELRRLGLDIYSVAGRGYRLRTPLELLDADRVRAGLSSSQAGRLAHLDVLERTDSTNAELARCIDGTTRACLAEYQSAGRGRAARPWVSPFGANLYLSLAHDMSAPRAPLGALSLAVGGRVAEALTSLGAQDMGLKWPNDLWAGDRKLGGILIEHRGEAAGAARLIVGVGINVSMQAPQAAAVDQPWTRLADHMPAMPGRNHLAASVLGAVLDAVTGFEARGFADFRALWSRFDVTRNRGVRLIENDGERFGIARGIGADGALQVEIRGVSEAVYAGDVSLRVSGSGAG